MKTLRVAVLLLIAMQLASFTMLINLSHRPVESSNTTVYHTDASVPGPMGLPGVAGIQGVQGTPGKDGKSLAPITTVTYLPGQKGDTGVAGQNGVNGADAPTLQLRKNPANGDLEDKYDTDDTWNVLLKKCDYTETCNG